MRTDAADDHRPGRRVHFLADLLDGAVEHAVRERPGMDPQGEPGLERRQVGLGHIELDPEQRRIAHHKKRGEQVRRVCQHLVVADLLSGIDVALHHDARDRRTQDERLARLGLAPAVEL